MGIFDGKIIMNIYDNIEQAKKYIENRKFNDALELLRKSLTVKLDSNVKDEIFFEIGKIYFIKEKYKKSIFYFNKVQREDLKQFSYDLLLQIYDKLEQYNEVLNVFHKLDKNNANIYMLHSALNAAYKLERVLEILSVINIIRSNNIHDNLLEKLINTVYKHLSEKIQLLNVKNKREKVKDIYKKIYKHIPNNDVKFKNIVLNEYEIAMSKKTLKSYPRLIQIVITTKCNLNCIMCGKLNRDGKYELSDKRFHELLQLMPYLQRLILRGGEVFYYKYFDKTLEEAYKNNVEIEILTNGLLLNKSNIAKLIEANVVLNFSIDSPIKETYESIRSGAKYNELISNILLLNKIEKEKKSQIKSFINMVVMRKNYKEIFDMIKFAKKYNFQGVTLNPIIGLYNENCFSSKYKDNIMIIKELNKNRKKYELFAKANGINLINKLPRKTIDFDKEMVYSKKGKPLKIKKTLINSNLINKKMISKKEIDKVLDDNCCEKVCYEKEIRFFCHAPWREIFLDEKSLFKPHCLCEKNVKIKNSKTYNNILNLWNSKLMKKYRKKISEGRAYDVCNMGCLSNRYINYDNYRII